MAFSLREIRENLGGIFRGSKEFAAVGIDIGASSAKIVQLRASRGTAILETYGEIALGPYGNAAIGKAVKLSPEKTAEAITDLMREANVTARVGGLSIPFSSSLVTVLDLPKVDNETLKRIVPIEARKYIPIPASEVTLDWFVIPADEGEMGSAFDQLQAPAPIRAKGQEVLLVAIRNDILGSYQTIAATTGLTVNFYEIEIFSAIRSSVGHGIAPILVVDLGASTTKMYIVERGVVRMTHLVTAGGQHMTENLARSLSWEFEKAERVKRERGLIDSNAYGTDENSKIKAALLSTLIRVFSEIERVLLSYGQRYNKNVSHVLLTGGGASLPGLSQQAKESLHAEVEIADPFAHTESPAFLEGVLKEIGPGFAVSVGLALRKLKSE
ncbi:MAG TPA: type IV pilus assembly protein PilM [Candidatus Paceibacterota bacterium]